MIDGRNLFVPEEARRAGFDYTGIGRALVRSNSVADPPNPLQFCDLRVLQTLHKRHRKIELDSTVGRFLN